MALRRGLYQNGAMTTRLLSEHPLSLADWRAIRDGDGVALDEAARERIAAAADTVATIAASGETVYGINTGFGKLARTSIPADKLAELQRNLVLSHSAGVGAPLADSTMRLVLALKVASFAHGHSGIRVEIAEALIALLDAAVYPVVPSKGSVGASGDLAPLAHVAGTLLGTGQMRHQGSVMPAAEGLARARLAPMTLGPKEGLALLNGTQVSTALALEGLFGAEDAFAAAVVAGALSTDAAQGSVVPFDPRIHEIRRHPGQRDVAAHYARLLDGSSINQSHIDCDRVQDPYSLRCQPQVMGACLDHLRFAAAVVGREAHAVSDNPLVFPADGDVLSGGNFHAEPVAMAADVIALALAEIGSLAERRIALLMDPVLSSLPAFLTPAPGLNSGLMIAQVTAAALAAENKALAHPSSVDSLPTSANQEDHVSMATHAARRLADMSENAAAIVAIELIAACQGIDFHAPLASSPPLEEAKAAVRARVPMLEEDRVVADDIEAITALVAGGVFRAFVPGLLPGDAGA